MRYKNIFATFLACIMVLNIFNINIYATQEKGMKCTVEQDLTQEKARAIVESIFSANFDKSKIKNIELMYDSEKNIQIGTFSGAKGTDEYNILEFDKGVALSTGDLKKGIEYDGESTTSNIISNRLRGTKRVTIDNYNLYDPASIEFDLELETEEDITFKYAFGSEEYMQYSLSKFNDKFGIIINGENYAKVPNSDEIIAIATVNQVRNKEFFRPNINYEGIKSLNLRTPLNGITRTFTASTKLKAGTNHIKIAIGDMADSSFDSVLFIKAKSFELRKLEAGKLSVERTSEGKVLIKRIGENGQEVADGTISFVLEEESLTGEKTSTVYTMGDGETTKTIEVSADGEDDEEKIAFDTKKVVIKNAKMGATIDDNKSSVNMKIAAPKLKITGVTKDSISIKGEPNATVQITKDGQSFNPTSSRLNENGELTLTELEVGTYVAKQTSGELISGNSNKIVIKKPPVIYSDNDKAFEEDTIDMNTTGNPVPYNLAELGVKAKSAASTDITSDLNVVNPLATDTNEAGIYTIKWSVTNSDFTTVKTKVVKVRPTKPTLFADNFKDSIINIKGLPNATVEVKVGDTLFETVQLDGEGNGVILDPPNGNYTAIQVQNGVESEPFDGSVDINRTFNKPVITLKGQDTIELVFDKDGSNQYTESGVTVTDTEDNANPDYMESGFNKYLNEKVTIVNPMVDKEGTKINVAQPALNKDGTPVNSNAFEPFVGKYVIKYEVEDSDGMVGKSSRLVKVRPQPPTIHSLPVENIDAKVEVDALSSASVYLYDENDKPINIVDGKRVEVPAEDLYKDGKHVKLKIDKQSNKYDNGTDYFAGLPLGKYYLRQRLYGLNSDRVEFNITHSQKVPTIALTGSATQVMEVGSNYTELGATAKDGYNKPLDVQIDDSKLKVGKVGVYKVTYTTTDPNNGKNISVNRNVVVKPKMPEITIGDYVANDANGDVTPNRNGNDIKIKGEPNAIVEIVKGKGNNGALYEEVTLDDNGETIIQNLEKTTDTEYTFAAFQTVNDIQSGKYKFDIAKTDNMPTLTIDSNSKVITVEKGSSVTLRADVATADDTEDGNLNDKVLIYKQVNDEFKLQGNGANTLVLNNEDTKSVGAINSYYSVKDSDGNSVIKVRQVDVLPKAPVLSADSDKISATGLEVGAIFELFKVDNDGTKKLFATKKVGDNGTVEFTELDTGDYIAKQRLNAFESAPSKKIAFKNPAYFATKLVDDENNVLENIEVSIKNLVDDTENKKDVTASDGTVLFGVESADNIYEIKFSNSGNDFKVKGISSEDVNALHTKTTAVGALMQGNSPIVVADDKLAVTLKKKVGDNKYKNSHLAKMVYDSGKYLLTNLTPNAEYLIDLGHLGRKDEALAIAELKVRAGAAGTVKLTNKQLNFGVVKDKSGKALSGAKVTLYRPDRDNKPDYEIGAVDLPTVEAISTRNQNGYVTGADGKYAFSVYDNVPYVIVVKKSGYADVIKFVESVDGELLGEDIEMTKVNSSSSDVWINESKSDSKDDGKKDDDKSEKQSEVINITDKVDDKADALKDGLAAYYKTENPKNTTVSKEPKKGKVYLNPKTGSILYIPNYGAKGEDDFTINSKDKKGNSKNINRKVDLSDTNYNKGEDNTLHMEINSDSRKGFVGEEVKFDVELRNDSEEAIKGGSVAIKIPDGFAVPKGSKLEVVSGHIILDVDKLKKDEKKNMQIALEVISADKEESILTGVAEVEGAGRISPMSVSSVNLNVYEVGKKYQMKSYIKGMPDGNFYKDKPVTRAEVAAMLTRCLDNEGKRKLSDKEANFADVKKDAWYSNYVDKAVKYGLFGGFEDGTFKPNKNITRAELAKSITNYFRMNISEKGKVGENFKDVDGHWAEDSIYSLKRYGISNGYEDGSYRPNKAISRQETVKMINAMLGRDAVLDVKSSFGDTHSGHWSFNDIETAYRGYEFEKNKQGDIIVTKLK